jgi:hypothetical protein
MALAKNRDVCCFQENFFEKTGTFTIFKFFFLKNRELFKTRQNENFLRGSFMKNRTITENPGHLRAPLYKSKFDLNLEFCSKFNRNLPLFQTQKFDLNFDYGFHFILIYFKFNSNLLFLAPN